MGSVPHRACARRPADRQQRRSATLPNGAIPRHHIGRHGRGLEIEGGEAPCNAAILAWTAQQAPDPKWDVTEQRAECRGVKPLAGQRTPASRTGAALTSGDRHLCRDDLRLEGGGELLCLCKTELEVRQAGLLIAFDARDLDLPHLPGLQPVTSLTRHTGFATSSLSSREHEIYRKPEQTPEVCMLPTRSGRYFEQRPIQRRVIVLHGTRRHHFRKLDRHVSPRQNLPPRPKQPHAVKFVTEPQFPHRLGDTISI
jgi:hypothetical protein